MNRRNFFVRVGGLVVAVPSVLHLVACGDAGESDGSGGAGGAPAGDTFEGETTASAGHTHTVTVRCSDVAAGDGVTYTSSKAGGHTHSVTLSAVQLSKLALGETVTFETNSLHLHSWMLSPGDACA